MKWTLQLMPIVAAFAVVAMPSPGWTDAIALDFDTNAALYPASVGDNTLGWQFSVLEPLTVKSLGIFDAGAPGLAETHQVAIWNLSETMIVSTTVGNTSQPYPAAGGNGRWMFEAVAPTMLQTGSYVIGAHYPSSIDRVGSNIDEGQPIDVFTHPTISWDQLRFSGNTATGFEFPSFGASWTGHFGPSFLVVPEPSCLLVFSALTLLGIIRRR